MLMLVEALRQVYARSEGWSQGECRERAARLLEPDSLLLPRSNLGGRHVGREYGDFVA